MDGGDKAITYTNKLHLDLDLDLDMDLAFTYMNLLKDVGCTVAKDDNIKWTTIWFLYTTYPAIENIRCVFVWFL